MILSVSRRTDIPAFYSEWFFNRIKEGFVYVRNPLNIHLVSRISLDPKLIDCIVFWSKNPKPMLKRLDELKDYMYYFQFTINPYNEYLENRVPKKQQIIDTFHKLSDAIGPQRTIWRYDPILLTNGIDINYHVTYFEEIAKRLYGFTNTCVISFVDLYNKTQRNLKDTSARELTMPEIFELASKLIIIAQKYGMKIQSCAEDIALEKYGIVHGKCIDNVLIEDLLDLKLVVSKDKNQRKECGCVQSIDIGEYNTCLHGCKYCYANFDSKTVEKKQGFHNPNSPLLIGKIEDNDRIVERKLFSFVKLPEPYEIGDFVKLIHPEKYCKEFSTASNPVNIFKINTINSNACFLNGVEHCVPIDEIKPIKVNGIEDRWIYYNPLTSASIVFPGMELTPQQVDYSYYLDSFKKCFYNGKNYCEIVEKKKLCYVHEIQHLLKEIGDNKGLKININKIC